VIQFSATSLDEYDALIELETALIAEKGIYVDGHDFGMDEFNIFVHTDELKITFERISNFIQTQRPELAFTAGFRDFSEDDYIPLWPASLKSFSVA
jgi:hypothetical protein